MASTELEILITATNQAKAILDEVTRGIAGINDELSKVGQNTETQRAADQMNAIIRPISRAEAALQRAGKAAKATTKDFSAAGAGASALGRQVVSLGAAFLGLRAGINLVTRGIREAAATQRLDTALRALGEGAGLTSRQLQGAVRSIEAFGVGGAQARDSIRRLVQANVDLATGTRLAEAAQRLALATGEATDETFRKLTFAVQTGNVQLLRRAGIVVDQAAAEQTLADQLGISVAALDEQQKKQAVANAIIAEGAKLQSLAGEAVGTFAARLAILPNVTGDLAESIGNELLPGVNAFLGSLTLFIQNLRLSIQQFTDATNFSERFGEALTNLGALLVRLVGPVSILIDLVGELTLTFLSLVDNLTGFVAVLLLLLRFIPFWGQVLTIVLGIIAALDAAGVNLADLFRGLVRALNVFVGVAGLIFFDFVDKFKLGALDIQEIWEKTMAFFGRRTEEQLKQSIADINKARAEIARVRQERQRRVFAGPTAQPSPESKELEANRNRIKVLNAEILASENAVVQAREAGDAAAVASGVFKVQQLQKEKAAITETITKLKEQADAETSLGKERDKRAEAGKAAKLEVDRIKAVNKAFTDLLQGQGLATQGFTNLSATGSKAVTDLERVLLDLNKRFQEGSELELPKVRLAILGAFGQLKTVDDFTNAIAKLNDAIDAGVQGLDNLRAEARFRQAQVALTEINSELGFFNDALTQIRDLQDNYNNLVLSGVQADIALKQVNAEIAGDRRLQNALELQSIASEVAATRNKFDQEKALIQATAKQQIGIAQNNIKDQKSQTAAILAIDDQKTQALLKNSRTYYDSLRTAQNQFLQQFRTAAQEVKSIDQASAASQRSSQQTIRDIRRGTFSEEGQQFDRRRELVEQQDQFQFAVARKDTERAKAALARQKELAGQIQGGAGDPEANAFAAIRILEEVEAQQQQLFTTERAVAQGTADQAKVAFEALGVEIAKVTNDFNQLAQERVVSLKVQVDNTALTSAVDQIKNAFESIVVTVAVSPATQISPAQATPAGFAGGGRVPGHSPHSRADNILARLTAGEWVTPVNAVKFWGADFMRSINNMRMPKFADGGPVMRFAEGGSIGDTTLSGALNRLTSATSGLIASNQIYESNRPRPVTLDFGQMGTFEVQGNDKQIENLKKAISQAAIKRRRS